VSTIFRRGIDEVKGGGKKMRGKERDSETIRERSMPSTLAEDRGEGKTLSVKFCGEPRGVTGNREWKTKI